MMPAAASGITLDLTTSNIVYVTAGLVLLALFLVAARYLSRMTTDQLVKRHVRNEIVVTTRRGVTFVVIGLGIFAALALAVQSANVALIGLVLATIVAALGVQDLLRDYVSGYYVLLERHMRVGDVISFDNHTGTIVEVRLRVTLLRGEEGNVIVVPNSELFTKAVLIHGKTPEEAAKPAPPG